MRSSKETTGAGLPYFNLGAAPAKRLGAQNAAGGQDNFKSGTNEKILMGVPSGQDFPSTPEPKVYGEGGYFSTGGHVDCHPSGAFRLEP